MCGEDAGTGTALYNASYNNGERRLPVFLCAGLYVEGLPSGGMQAAQRVVERDEKLNGKNLMERAQ